VLTSSCRRITRVGGTRVTIIAVPGNTAACAVGAAIGSRAEVTVVAPRRVVRVNAAERLRARIIRAHVAVVAIHWSAAHASASRALIVRRASVLVVARPRSGRVCAFPSGGVRARVYRARVTIVARRAKIELLADGTGAFGRHPIRAPGASGRHRQ
jgi:hypothetical protein